MHNFFYFEVKIFLILHYIGANFAALYAGFLIGRLVNIIYKKANFRPAHFLR